MILTGISNVTYSFSWRDLEVVTVENVTHKCENVTHKCENVTHMTLAKLR